MDGITSVVTFQGNNIRFVWHDDEPCFVIKDFCASMGMQDVKKTTDAIEKDELYSSAIGKEKFMSATPRGLFRLLMHKKSVKAKAFMRWLTHEVQPKLYRELADSLLPKDAVSLLATTVSQGNLLLHQNSELICRLDKLTKEVNALRKKSVN